MDPGSRRYQRARGDGPDRLEFARQQRESLESFIMFVDRSIQRNQKRTELAQGYTPEAVDLEAHPEVLDLTVRIEAAVKEAEKAGEEGNVDESVRLLAEAETLRATKVAAQRRLLSTDTKPTGGAIVGNFHLLRVCRVCGAMLSVKDSDERLAEHFGGRMHLGVVKVRERLLELEGGASADGRRRRAGPHRPPTHGGVARGREPGPRDEDRVGAASALASATAAATTATAASAATATSAATPTAPAAASHASPQPAPPAATQEPPPPPGSVPAPPPPAAAALAAVPTTSAHAT